MYKWIGLLCLALVFSLSSLEAKKIDKILLFGDSYFDTGAGNALAMSLGINLMAPTPPYFNGRSSNGPIWVDYVSWMLNLDVTNYAIAGATSGTNNLNNPSLGGLFQQIERYQSEKKKIQSDTLVIVDGGANDFFALIGTSNLTPEGLAAQTQATISNLLEVYSKLQILGAKKIVAWNFADSGAIPLLNDPAFGLTDLKPIFTEIAVNFNPLFAEAINNFNSHNEAHVYVFDSFTTFNQVLEEYRQAGIDTSLHTITTMPDGTFIISGPRPDQTAFYDQVHPTTQLFKVFSNYKADFLKSIIDKSDSSSSESDENLVLEGI